MRNIVTKRSWLAVLAALMAVALCAPAWAETYLWSRHHSNARLVDGKSNYEGPTFSRLGLFVDDDDRDATDAYMNATGTMTIVGGSYTFWNGTEDEAVSGTIKSFPLKAAMDATDGYLEYGPTNGSGSFVSFYDAADTGLNGREVRWEFPAMPELDGKATVPNFRSTAQQLKTYVPYVELVRSGGNVTGVKFRVVHPSAPSKALSLSNGSDLRVNFFDHDDNELWRSEWKTFAVGETVEGTYTLGTPIPESELCYVHVRFWDRDLLYSWSFVSSTANDDAGIASWGELEQTPLKIKEGETAAVAVSLRNGYRLSTRDDKVFVGDSSVLSVTADGAGTGTATLSLKGLKPGKTTVRLFYYRSDNSGSHYSTSAAREVWVTDENGEIPSGSGGDTGSGGGGCDVGIFGALSLAIVGAALIARKRQ